MSRMIRLVAALVLSVMGFAGVMQQTGAQAATGTVNVQNYYCTYLDSTIQLEAIDGSQCSPGSATFTFYLEGDGTNAFKQVTTGADGQGSIDLAVGSYDVVAEETQTHFPVSVTDGQSLQLLVGNPAATPAPSEVPVSTGTVNVQNYYCSYLDSTLLVEAIDQDKCSPGSATFSFYLVGDGTNAVEQVTTGAGGQGVIELTVGSYDMVAEESQAHFAVNVLAGENVVLLIANPAAAVAPSAPAPAAVPSATTPAPTVKLPSTGTGTTSDFSILSLAMTAAAAIAGGGALTVRKIHKG